MNLPHIEARPDLFDEAERWSVDELRARQLERLQWSVRHAFDHVAHYRKAFEDRGVHPDDFRSLDDTRLLPFTSKADLRANYPFGMFAVPREQVSRVHASSGTTGKPTVVGYTAEDLTTWSSLMARSIRAAGGRPGDVVHVAYGYGLFTGGLGAIFGAEAWTQAMRAEIEERASLHAVDIFGLSEVMGPGVAQECVESKDGLH